VLLVHLTLFGYIYPGEAALIPQRVLATLTDRLRREAAEPPQDEAGVCRGTILSRSQYLVDTHLRGTATPGSSRSAT